MIYKEIYCPIFKSLVLKIRPLVLKTLSQIKVTTRFMSGKRLSFSLASFIYCVIDVSYFLNKKLEINMSKSKIIKCFKYLLLKDTDSTLLKFIFFFPKECLLFEEGDKSVCLKLHQAVKFSSIWTVLTNTLS